jgi:SAM-dependent methyltransferase
MTNTNVVHDSVHQAEMDHWANRAQYIFNIHHKTRAGRYLLRSMISRFVRMTGIDKDSRILEVGCAGGTQTIAFEQAGYEKAMGLDIDPRVLDIAVENCKGMNVHSDIFILGDAQRLPLPDQSYDMVFSVGVMEHLTDLHGSLLEQKRILVDGGWIIMAVPNRYCPWWTTIKKWRAMLSNKPHFAFPDIFRTFSPEEGFNALKKAGYKDISIEIGDAVLPQCPDWFASVNILLEKIIDKTSIIRKTQAMLYVGGRR